MNELFSEAIAAIPTAVTSPLSFIAYLAALGVWGFIAYRVRVITSLRSSIQDLPEKDRIASVRMSVGEVPVQEFTAVEYLKLRKQKYIFQAFLAFCFTCIVILGISISIGYKNLLDKEKITNELIDSVLDRPSSQYMSAFNTLTNAPGAIKLISGSLEPNLSPQELDALVDEYAARGYTFEEIKVLLAQRSSGGALQEVNEKVLQVVARLDESFSELRNCFQNQRCTETAERMPVLCRALIQINSNVSRSNELALSIPSVTFIQYGSSLITGNGIMDRTFKEIRAENTEYLIRLCQ